MILQKGFSLLELLISLVLFTSISLALFTHHQKLFQFLNHLNQRINAIHITEAGKELMLSKSHD